MIMNKMVLTITKATVVDRDDKGQISVQFLAKEGLEVTIVMSTKEYNYIVLLELDPNDSVRLLSQVVSGVYTHLKIKRDLDGGTVSISAYMRGHDISYSFLWPEFIKFLTAAVMAV